MRSSIKLLPILFSFLLCLNLTLLARQEVEDTALGQPPQTETVSQADNTAKAPPQLRRISPESLQELLGDDEMDYNLASPDDNLWVKFRNWLFLQLMRLFGTPNAANAIEVIVYVIIGLAMLYAILRLLNIDLSGLFAPKNRRATVLPEDADTHENIHAIDFQEAIAEALKAREFNRAVRLLYLSALKELTDREHIHWQAGKTNYQYQQELNSKPLQAPFRDLGHLFEWAWYGNFTLNEKHFEEARTIYQSLQHNLQQGA